jgi:hypothetical protein
MCAQTQHRMNIFTYWYGLSKEPQVFNTNQKEQKKHLGKPIIDMLPNIKNLILFPYFKMKIESLTIIVSINEPFWNSYMKLVIKSNSPWISI